MAMPVMQLDTQGDGAWSDLRNADGTGIDQDKIYEVHQGDWGLSALDGGMVNGKPSVALRIDGALPDGRTMIIQSSLAMFTLAADMLRARFEYPYSPSSAVVADLLVERAKQLRDGKDLQHDMEQPLGSWARKAERYLDSAHDALSRAAGPVQPSQLQDMRASFFKTMAVLLAAVDVVDERLAMAERARAEAEEVQHLDPEPEA